MSDFEDRYVMVAGVKTRYWQVGKLGSPVILLHGIGCSVLDWQSNITAFSTQHRVHAVDLLGYGLTEKTSEECIRTAACAVPWILEPSATSLCEPDLHVFA